jgi:hypothetical protein
MLSTIKYLLADSVFDSKKNLFISSFLHFLLMINVKILRIENFNEKYANQFHMSELNSNRIFYNSH